MKRNKFIDYDYDSTFEDNVRNLSESRIEELLNKGKIISCYATKTIRSGPLFEVEVYPQYKKRSNAPPGIRKSYKAQKHLNEKNAKKKLIRLVNCNFTAGDIWVTFTYDKDHCPDNIERIRKDVKNYIQRIRRIRRKKELPDLKYIYVIEFGAKNKRPHIHMIMDGALSLEEVESTWHGGGRNTTRRIVPDDDDTLMGLSKYIAKDPQGKKRWASSKNLKQPVIRKNHQTFRKKHIRAMVTDENSIGYWMEKKYPGYLLKEAKAYTNEYNGGFYITARLYRIEKRERQ